MTARTLSFTRAGLELRVTQAAVSQQVKGLEDRLGAQLFRRLPRGVALTDEGQLLLPSIVEAFRRLTETLNRFEDNRYQDVISVGAVGTFAAGWLLPRLGAFRKAYPTIDLRLFTNNNRVDIAGEGLDYAIRFGDGLWHGTEATRLLAAPFSPVLRAGIGAQTAPTRRSQTRGAAPLLSRRGVATLVRRGGTDESGYQGNGFRFIGHDGKRSHAGLRRCIVAGGDVSRRAAPAAAGSSLQDRSAARRLLDYVTPLPAPVNGDAVVQELVLETIAAKTKVRH